MSARLNKKIRVAILGSGGREHALAMQVLKSPFCQEVAVFPGNQGMNIDSPIQCRALPKSGIEPLIAALREFAADFVIIGPDDLLYQGYTDALEKAGFPVFGPSQKASKVEWSKAFAKQVLSKANVPTAPFMIWKNAAEARQALPSAAAQYGGYPLVLKYDGLALGKGVKVVANETEALEFISLVYDQKIFDRDGACSAMICEEFIAGHEVSIFALCDGNDCTVLEPACDHKRLLDRNQGPNTGGMGAFSPVPWLDQGLFHKLKQELFLPVLNVLRESHTPFKGLLYAGLMITPKGYSVLEFNARFGDPETQALLPRLESDLLPVLWGCAHGDLEAGLDIAPLRWTSDSCVNVVAASGGYPDNPRTGYPLNGFESVENVSVYFAGVKRSNPEDSKSLRLTTSGGRVFSVSALGSTLTEARELAYGALEKITFEGMHFRRDIGLFYE